MYVKYDSSCAIFGLSCWAEKDVYIPDWLIQRHVTLGAQTFKQQPAVTK